MSTALPPAQGETRAVPVGGPRHYAAKTCAERGWHRIRRTDDLRHSLFVCEDCTAAGNAVWARGELLQEGDFLKTLVDAIENMAGGKAA